MKRRIGIYTGTFDPVHNGHIGFALRSLDVAKLDEVVLIPEKTPRDKEHVADLSHRFELLVRATEPYGGLSVRLLTPEQFCVQGTMPELRAMYDDADLYLLLGSDVVKTFSERWANLEDLFRHMGLVIGLRQGDTRKELKKFLKYLNAKVQPRYIFVESPLSAVNSTRVRSGVAIRDIAPEVSEYIERHKLYEGR